MGNLASPVPSAAHASLTVATEGMVLLVVAGLLGFVTGVFTQPFAAAFVSEGGVIRALAALTLSYLVARVAGLLVQGALRRRESRALAAGAVLIGARIAEKLSRRSE